MLPKKYGAGLRIRFGADRLRAVLLIGVLVVAAVLPSPPGSGTPARAATNEDAEPEAVFPDAVAGRETVRRTAHSRLDRAASGVMEATFSQRPMHWYDEREPDPGGRWKPFANDLGPATTPGMAFESQGNG